MTRFDCLVFLFITLLNVHCHVLHRGKLVLSELNVVVTWGEGNQSKNIWYALEYSR